MKSRLQSCRVHGALAIAISFVGLAACNDDTQVVDVSPATVTRQPTAVSVVVGASAEFSVDAVGAAPLSYQWRRDGVPLAGMNAPSLRIVTTLADDGARFSVEVSNPHGTVSSVEAALFVSPVPAAPIVVQSPTDQWVVASSDAVFAVTATGSDPMLYQWQRNGTSIPNATDRVLTLDNTSLADDGAILTVSVSNPAGITLSAPATLHVTQVAVPPVITAAPRSAQGVTGSTVFFNVSVAGTAPLTYQWKRNGTPIQGETQPMLAVGGVQASDDGALLSVLVSNAAGSTESPQATLTVTSVPVSPGISSNPQSVTVNPGASASFSVQATGTAPLAFQWYRDGAAVTGATSLTYTIAVVDVADDGALFAARVSNPAGVATSFSARLGVTPQPIAPSFTQQPMPATVVDGDTAVFNAVVAGTNPISYQWRRNGVDIPGAQSPVLVLTATSAADNGALFTLRASNAAGQAVSSAALLAVNPPSAPVIVQSPRGVILNSGQSALFAVYATGTGPLQYQWLRDGGTIPGATTSVLELPAFVGVADHCASFSVRVSNAGGTVSSTPALLRVNERPGVDPASTPCEHTVLGQQVPIPGFTLNDCVPCELGMKFVADRAGHVVAVRYWKPTNEPVGGHVGRIWTANGTLLASVAFAGETAAGWQSAALASPLALTPGVVYVVTVNANSNFVISAYGGLALPIVRGAVSSLDDPAPSLFGPAGAFPTQAAPDKPNYFRDIAFVAD